MSNGTAVATMGRHEVAPQPKHEDQLRWEVVARQADAWAKSTIIPENYRGQPANCLVALEMAHRSRIPVLAVMQNLHIIQGRPSWSAQFLIAAVNGCGRFSPLRYRFEGQEGQDSWGCRAVAVDRESGEELVGALITISMAKAEGWATKSGSKWKTMPEQMLRYRAAAFWARTYAPELAVGLHTAEELEDLPAPGRARVDTLAQVLDAEPVEVEAEVEDEGAATVAQVHQLTRLRDKAREADCIASDDEAAIQAAIQANDGPQVRGWATELSKRLVKAGAAEPQGSLLGEEG